MRTSYIVVSKYFQLRYLFTTIIFFSQLITLAQSPQDYGKVILYKTDDGHIYNQEIVDSLGYKANHFISKTKIRQTKDSVFYSIKHFDKALAADRYEKDGTYCGNSKRKSLNEVKGLYPYRAIHSIKVVSFKGFEIPKTNGQIDLKKMFEIKSLDVNLTNKMLDIMANYDNKGMGMDIAFCWDPRNAVVFLDKSEKVIGYIEICFDCQQYKIQPEELPISNFCNEKMDAVQGLMIRAGISHGMTRNY